jgi:hypothetical protein
MSWSGEHAIAHADVLTALRELPDCSVDGVLTDPPYGLGSHQPTFDELIAYLRGAELDTGGDFMGKDWSVPSVTTWRELLRVMKPGAPLLSYGGSRTYDLITLGLRAAGFEVRDALMWLYAKGFPKSLNVGLAIDNAAGAERPVIGTRVLTGNAAISTKEKGGTYGVQVGSVPAKEVNVTGPATELAQQWDGYGTALKPAWEPVVLARKPLDGTVAHNIERWGVGGLAIDDCRIGTEIITQHGRGDSQSPALAGPNVAEPAGREWEGRWPANLVLDEDAGAMLDAQAGDRPSRKSVTRNGGGNAGGDVFTKRKGGAKPDAGYSDSGGPSRFFFCTKVSTKEREYGCAELPKRSAGECTDRIDGSAGLSNPRAGAGRGGGARNHHPTLKPVSLNAWLAALIKPPTDNAILLVPYSGAGSEMVGALRAGWPSVFGIERDEDFVTIAHARIAAWAKGAP